MASGGGGRPIRALNVAEKPSVAKQVAGILSRNPASGGLRVRDGRSRYNRIFEFNCAIRNQQFEMSFTSVTGHVMELGFHERYRNWHSCDPVDLYQAPVKKYVPQDKLDIQKTLEEEAKKCQWLILWLDCDREGENIAFEVMEICMRANPKLKFWRARFSALTDRDIYDAISRLSPPNQLQAEAVDLRLEIDLRIGASFTRFQTLLLRDAFILDSTTDETNVVLSYGPCQFPTLGFVVERFWEIQSHEPEEFWTINCTHNSDEGTVTFNWMRGHLFDYTCAAIAYEMCVEEPTATVTNVRHQEKPKYPPYPLSTIELEKRASRYFRMSSEQTMKVSPCMMRMCCVILINRFLPFTRFPLKAQIASCNDFSLYHPLVKFYSQRGLFSICKSWEAFTAMGTTMMASGSSQLVDNQKSNFIGQINFPQVSCDIS